MDRVILITGGASGIGRATASLFSQKKDKVAIVDIDKSSEEIVELIKKEGNQALFVHADISEQMQAEKAVRICAEKWGRLDIVFNNAGILCPEKSLVEMMRVIDTNLKGTLFITEFSIPYMKKQGGGVIIFNSSIAGITGAPEYPAYSASKSAFFGLTKSLVRKLARNNIRVNCICPGSIKETKLLLRNCGISLKREDYLKLIQKIPIGRIGKPEDIAALVWFLSSENASFINGSIIVIDGGESLSIF